MNVLEKILEEIEEKFKTADAEKCDCEELCDVEDWYDSGYIDGQLSAHEKCMDIIRSHMNEVENDGWIPYTEQNIPKKEGIYLVTCDDKEYPVKRMRFKKNLWYRYYGIYNGRILAWQPLPEPYKGE